MAKPKNLTCSTEFKEAYILDQYYYKNEFFFMWLVYGKKLNAGELTKKFKEALKKKAKEPLELIVNINNVDYVLPEKELILHLISLAESEKLGKITSPEDYIKKDYQVSLIYMLDPADMSEELKCKAVQMSTRSLHYIGPVTFSLLKIALESKNFELDWFEEKFMHDLSDNQIEELLHINPWIFAVMHDLLTQNNIKRFLQIPVKANVPIKIGYFGKYHFKVRKDLADKAFYQGMCMMSPFNYQLTPKEYISDTLIRYTFEHAQNDNEFYFMYLGLPDKFRTEEITLLCAMKTECVLRALPAALQTDEFYNSLMDFDLFSFINIVPFETISKKVIKRWLQEVQHNVSTFPEKLKKSMDSELCMIATRLERAFEIIQPSMINREICEAYIKSYGYAPQVVDYMTEDDWLVSCVKNNYTSRVLPVVYQTEEFYMKLISMNVPFTHIPNMYVTKEMILEQAKKGILSNTSVRDIPKTLLDEDTVLAIYSNRKDAVGNYKDAFTDLPEREYQTESICREVMKSHDHRGYNHYGCLSWLKYQPPEYLKICIEESGKAIKDIQDIHLTKELIDYAIQCHVEAMLYAPSWYFDEQGNEDNVNVPVTPINALEDVEFGDCEQMSLFDLYAL